MTTTAGLVIKAAAPVLYARAVLPAIALAGLGLSLTDYVIVQHLGLEVPQLLGFAGAVALVLVVGGVVFAEFGQALLGWESLHYPTILDHLRHCALLYPLVALLVSAFVLAIHSEEADAGYILALIGMLSAGSGIAANALILRSARTRSRSLR